VTAEEAFKRISYYNTLNGALNALIEKEIKGSDAIIEKAYSRRKRGYFLSFKVGEGGKCGKCV
jgi:hypothetical protein